MLTEVVADPDNDGGDPREKITRYNSDPSWASEVNYFLNCIRKKCTIEKGSSDDAYKTMQLVYRIYYADDLWRDAYSISNPH